jgi:tRNA A37 N6-isopentenylltransferase MiaA
VSASKAFGVHRNALQFEFVARPFYIVGPTAAGKSRLAADVARLLQAEIVNTDAYQIYEGLPLLTAKPDADMLTNVPHHLIGSVPLGQIMNAGKFRRMALRVIEEIHASGKPVLVAGGSGLYVKALTHGLDSDWKKSDVNPQGVLIFRAREELYQRIDNRVEMMFANGVINEVRASGTLSLTAEKMIGLREIRQLLDRKISLSECIAAIQGATRRYAKRQLTWFRHQTNFESLNLSLLTHNEAVTRILRKARLAFAQGND